MVCGIGDLDAIIGSDDGLGNRTLGHLARAFRQDDAS